MSTSAAASNLPVGARLVRREPLTEKSIVLAEQMARRGASESLIRAIGGEDAVEKLRHLPEEAPEEKLAGA